MTEVVVFAFEDDNDDDEEAKGNVVPETNMTWRPPATTVLYAGTEQPSLKRGRY